MYCTFLSHKASYKTSKVAFEPSFCFQAINILKAFLACLLLSSLKLLIAAWLNPRRPPNSSHFSPSSRDSSSNSSSDAMVHQPWLELKISYGNSTEWSPIRSVIIRVINKIGRPRSGTLICLSRVWLNTELDDTNSYYQLVIKMKISVKRRIAKL